MIETNEDWYEFQEACRWHKDNGSKHTRHTCSKNYGSIIFTCDEMYCPRIKKEYEKNKELKELFNS